MENVAPERTSFTVPLPALADCGECASQVHDFLKDQPGVRLVAIDRARREARVEIDGDFGAAQVTGLLQSVVAGASRRPSLAETHAGHTPDASHAADRHAHDDTPGHGHDHTHDFRAMAVSNRTRLLVVVAVGTLVVLVQLVGAWYSGSLLLYSDAAHMSTDVAAVALAAYAVHVAARPATPQKSFGWHRSEIVAAFLNAVGLWVVSAFFVVEAVRRVQDPPAVSGGIVLAVGAFTLVVNLGLASLLARGRKTNLNVHSAYLHVLSDVLGSAAAMVAGALVLFFGWTWADPLFTLLVTGIIVAGTWKLTRRTLHILLEGTPEETDTAAVRRDVLEVPGVRELHDLHVWSLTTGVHSMSAHLVVDDASRGPDVARRVREVLQTRHGLDHVTLEVEPAGMVCPSCG